VKILSIQFKNQERAKRGKDWPKEDIKSQFLATNYILNFILNLLLTDT
jgi:hypothetical protein